MMMTAAGGGWQGGTKQKKKVKARGHQLFSHKLTMVCCSVGAHVTEKGPCHS